MCFSTTTKIFKLSSWKRQSFKKLLQVNGEAAVWWALHPHSVKAVLLYNLFEDIGSPCYKKNIFKKTSTLHSVAFADLFMRNKVLKWH